MATFGEHPVTRCSLALIALAAAIAGQYWLAVQFNPTLAAVGWGVGMTVFVLLFALDAGGRELPSVAETLPPALEWPLAIAVLAVGVFYRTFRLSEVPAGLNHDVAWEGLYAATILQGIPYTPYVSSAWGRETFMFYWDAVSLKLFGMNLFAMTFPAVVAMVLMLPFFYGFARRMFGVRAALVLTLLFGVAGWPLISARVGWRAVLQPLFTTMTCMFFWRGVTGGRVADYALAGAALALTCNTYNAARLFPTMFVLFAGAYVLYHRGSVQFTRRSLRGPLVMLISFSIVVAPLAWYAVNNWVKFWGRASSLVTNQTPEMLAWTGARAAALLYNYWGNSDDFFVESPLLEVPAAVFFVFGLLWCVLRARDQRAGFLLLGMFVNLLPGLLTRANANRCIGTMPFVYCFAGLGLLYFVRHAQRLGRAGVVVAGVVLSLGLAAEAGATYREYLSHQRRRIWGFYPETTVLGNYMRTLVGRYSMFVGGANFPRDALTFLTFAGGDRDPFEREYTWVDDVATLVRTTPEPAPGRGLALILATIDNAPMVFDELLKRFPKHEIVDLHYPEPDGPAFARALLVPPSDVPQTAETKAPAAPPVGSLWRAGRGFEPGQFSSPTGIARGKRGEFYVADTANHRVQKFDAKGALVAIWGEAGNGPGQFKEPAAVGVDPDGNVHVVDTWNHRIQKFSPDGKLLTTYFPPKGFFGPRGIAFGKQRVYVTDGGNNLVDVFDLDGHFLSQFGGAGNSDGQMLLPVGIVVDAHDLVWVVDSGHNRLQAFKPDGTFVRAIAVPGWHGTEIKEAYLTVVEQSVILSDPVGSQLLLLKGDQLTSIESPTSLFGPAGVAADKTTVYVCERGRHAVARVPLKKG
ncbi:MAG TPA: glycosyltransferase family 39 protein [Candidatus Binatia bacterium]|nr:glycosyltransferase family 39 protein [Candidatus Binatia bacterium]